MREPDRHAAQAARRVLGLGPSADLEQVTHAYRTLARAWHPDTNSDPASPGRLAEIVAAYHLLKHQEPARPQDPVPEPFRAQPQSRREPVKPVRPRGATVVAGPVRFHHPPRS